MCSYEWCWLCGSMYTNNHYKTPLGCMDLQEGTNRKKDLPRWKLYLRRIWLILFVVFGIPCILSKYWQRKCGESILDTVIAGFLFLVGLILSTLLICLLPLFLPLVGVVDLVAYHRTRTKMRLRAQRIFAERLKEIQSKELRLDILS